MRFNDDFELKTNLDNYCLYGCQVAHAKRFLGMALMTAGAAAGAGAGGAAAGAGLAAGIGGAIAANPMMAAGIGMQAANMLGSSSGGAPSVRINLTPQGKALEKDLFTTIQKDLFPTNLAAKFIGQAKKIEQRRRRLSSKMFGATQIRSGKAAQALATEMGSRLTGETEGVRQLGEAKSTFARNRLTRLQNFMRLQMQAPVMRAQADIYKGEQTQMRGARQGQSLGNIAMLLALNKYPARY